MSGDSTSTKAVAGPGFPRLALGLAWTGASLATGVLGWILAAISERRADVFTGRFLVVVAVLGVVVLAGVISNRYRSVTLPASMAVSALLVIAGIVAATVLAVRDDMFISDVLLVGVVPVIGGVISGLLGRRAYVMAR